MWVKRDNDTYSFKYFDTDFGSAILEFLLYTPTSESGSFHGTIYLFSKHTLDVGLKAKTIHEAKIQLLERGEQYFRQHSRIMEMILEREDNDVD